MPLSERRSSILRFIVDDYVESAQPVGSQSLVLRHALGLSSATVRNEMAALEDEGLITHPHTSAGRIPSHRGYRYYVSSLMAERELAREEQIAILHQFHQSARQLEDWITLAASVLANALHNVGLITQPRILEGRLKHLQLVEIADNRILLVAVTGDAQLHQFTLELPSPASQEQLTRLANRLNAELGGKTAAEMSAGRELDALDSNESVIIAAVIELLIRDQRRAVEAPIVDGIRDLLRQPEFEGSDRMLDTLEAVDERHLRAAIPSAAVEASGDVAIVIGDENADGPYRDMSFVLTRYGRTGGPSGMVGILGPTRMQYGDAVSHVRYVRDVLTELLRQYYGES